MVGSTGPYQVVGVFRNLQEIFLSPFPNLLFLKGLSNKSRESDSLCNSIDTQKYNDSHEFRFELLFVWSIFDRSPI